MHDLARIWNDVNKQHFGGAVNVTVRWSPQVSKRRWAVYKVSSRVIEVNKLLDDESVPEQVIAFQLYHEGLHTIIPADHSHHPPEFRTREQEFPGYVELERWMAANADRLFIDDATLRAGLDRYGKRYGLSSGDAGKLVKVRSGQMARVLGWLPGGGDAPALLAYVDSGERFRISAKGLAILLSQKTEAVEQPLTEVAVVFDEHAVQKLRADYLMLMRNVPRVDTPEKLTEFGAGVRVFRDYVSAVLFGTMSGDSPLVTAAHATGKVNYDDDVARVKALDKRMREDGWDFRHELDAPGYAANPADRKFGVWLTDRDRWKARLDKKARELWKTLDSVLRWFKDYFGHHATLHAAVPGKEEHVDVEGMTVILTDAHPLEHVELWRASIKHLRARAERVMPWIWQRRLPIHLHYSGFKEGGSYDARGFINFNSLELAGGDVGRTVHVYAHEMGHHAHRVALSDGARKWWAEAVRADGTTLDLRTVLAKWPAGVNTTHSYAQAIKSRDSHLAIYLWIVSEHNNYDDAGFGETKFDTKEELAALVASGETTMHVPAHPVTAYGTKNPEEAFCEALGLLVAYGPRAVHPMIQAMLREVLGGMIHVGESCEHDHDALPPFVFVEGDPGIPVGRLCDPFAGLDEATARELREHVEGFDVDVLAVPVTTQETNYSCGAACLFAILRYWGAYEGREKALYDALETDPDEGTSLQKLVDIGQLFGLAAEARHGLSVDDLRRTAADGTTAILLIQSGTPQPDAECARGHYVVLIGVDTRNVYVMDPWLGPGVEVPGYLPIEEFEKRWVGCDGPGQVLQRSAAFIRGRVAPKVARVPLPQAQLIEAKAIGTAQLYGQTSMRDLAVRHQGVFSSTMRSRIRQASTNAIRELRPIVTRTEGAISAAMVDWFEGRSSYRDVQLETAKAWRIAYEQVRDVGRRASALERHGRQVDSRIVHEEEKWFRSAVREELSYWHTFLHEINENQVSEERIVERLEAYLKALRFMYESARIYALPDNVLLYWMGPRDEKNCDGCVYMLERSPFVKGNIPAVPRDGSTPCLTNCRHKIVVRVTEGQTDVQRRIQALEARGSMVSAMRRIKTEHHGPHRAQYVKDIAARAHPQARNPFHDAAPIPARTEPFTPGEQGIPRYPFPR